MNLTNVRLILVREVRDQLRDRRTMFMIFVLPMLIYPLMGGSMMQISQFMRERPTRVLVGGTHHAADLPPLVEGEHFAAGLFAESDDAKLLLVQLLDRGPGAAADPPPTEEERRVQLRAAVQSGECEAAVFFPDDFARRLGAFRDSIRQQFLHPPAGDDRRLRPASPPKVPHPEVIYNTASEKSLFTYRRVLDVLGRWNEEIRDATLAATGVPEEAARPFGLHVADVAAESGLRGAATWAKILPMILVLWAMTGAFYPAVDLCAGEKERGTLETLLSSPAHRSEIVLGKLLTVMLFSMATSSLNVISMGLTGWAVMQQFPTLGPPPPMAWVWLPIALPPVSALFSALCLAMAAFARSTKEGQYYLMPLILLTMPLVVLPMSPGVELSVGNSLIPITGLVLLLRSLLEGNVWQALPLAPPVAAVTLVCCWLAIRWAVDQFNSESVLFRESERLDLALAMRRLVRERSATPSAGAAAACGVIILVIKFFLSFVVGAPDDLAAVTWAAVLTQLGVILAPTLAMTFVCVSSPRQTLLLRWPRVAALPAAVLLAVALHPAVIAVQSYLQQSYPAGDKMRAALQRLQDIIGQAPLWQLLLLLAVLPAVCEELAFRGFILSGFRRLGRKWQAIVFSSLIFGFAHGVLQQSLIASLLGLLLGYLAIHSGSILPGILFHAVHNALAVSVGQVTAEMIEDWPLFEALLQPSGAGYTYRWGVVALGAVGAVALLSWFGRQPYERTPEELLQEAISHGGEEE